VSCSVYWCSVTDVSGQSIGTMKGQAGPLKMGPINFTETSVTKRQYVLLNVREDLIYTAGKPEITHAKAQCLL
jgi:hypothetical protein